MNKEKKLQFIYWRLSCYSVADALLKINESHADLQKAIERDDDFADALKNLAAFVPSAPNQ
jgi:hypothetical protein